MNLLVSECGQPPRISNTNQIQSSLPNGKIDFDLICCAHWGPKRTVQWMKWIAVLAEGNLWMKWSLLCWFLFFGGLWAAAGRTAPQREENNQTKQTEWNAPPINSQNFIHFFLRNESLFCWGLIGLPPPSKVMNKVGYEPEAPLRRWIPFKEFQSILFISSALPSLIFEKKTSGGVELIWFI